MNRFLIPTFLGMVLFTATQPALAQNFQNLPCAIPASLRRDIFPYNPEYRSPIR